mmetsp:Transcript_11237/g.33737  ORF Transcript_11237/g.33737 Transcript_11237/m.33737 type:complete len:149 (-) Transcript_11237:726-1172(-)
MNLRCILRENKAFPATRNTHNTSSGNCSIPPSVSPHAAPSSIQHRSLRSHPSLGAATTATSAAFTSALLANAHSHNLSLCSHPPATSAATTTAAAAATTLFVHAAHVSMAFGDSQNATFKSTIVLIQAFGLLAGGLLGFLPRLGHGLT